MGVVPLTESSGFARDLNVRQPGRYADDRKRPFAVAEGDGAQVIELSLRDRGGG